MLHYKKFQEPNLSTEIYYVNTEFELLEVLSTINERIVVEQMYPVLHLEAHGGDNGVKLASGEHVSWDVLLPYFRSINISLVNGLFLVLALCVSISIIGMIEPDQRAPFKAIICTTRDVAAIDIRNAFEVFYNEFFFDFNLKASIDAMNQVIDPNGPKFHLIHSMLVFNGILDPDRDPINFKQIVDRQATVVKASDPKMKSLPFKVVHKLVERRIRRLLSNTDAKRDYFSMKDLK